MRILALEYDANAYNFGTIAVSDSAPNTNLPDASVVAPPSGLSAAEELYVTSTGSGAKVRANLSWGAPVDAFIHSYDVEYENGSGWEYVTTTKSTSAQINDLFAGNFQFRVRSINTMGVRSGWVTTSTIVLAGLTTPPSAITGFSVRAIDGSAHIQWDRVTDLDVLHGGYIRMRHTPMTSGVTWAHGVDIGEALAGTATNVVLPLLSGTYMAKAVDSAGNFATNEIQATTTVPNILSFNVVDTQTEHPAYTGTKVNVVKSGSVIRLASGQTNGEYYFADTLDLGAVYTSRVTTNLRGSTYDIADLMDSRSSNIDTWGNFDGVPSDAVTAKLEIRITDDDTTGSPTWSAWEQVVVGDYSARGYQFRALITSNDTNKNIDITQLSVTVDMPDRNERAQSVAVPSGGSTITYTNAFKDDPMVGITAQNLATGDYWTLSNQTSSSFDINFYNSSDTGVARNINWIATGYGKAA